MFDVRLGPAPLLAAITRCPLVVRCRAGEPLACAAVAGAQAGAVDSEFQVPEPWSGHIELAPILFISSNPSIDESEVYPTADWDDPALVDFFEGRFDTRPVPWIDQRMRPLLATAPPRHRNRGTSFWFAARTRASELLQRPAVPGHDFALTEAVHCKSRAEQGVAQAVGPCSRMWLRPVLAAAAAKVVVLFGRHAKTAFQSMFGIEPGAALTGPVDLEGASRIVLQLPHPNARGQRRDCHPLTAPQLTMVRRHLADHADGH